MFSIGVVCKDGPDFVIRPKWSGYIRPRTSRTISSRMTAPIAE